MIKLCKRISKERNVTAFEANNFIVHCDSEEFHIFDSKNYFNMEFAGSRALEVKNMSIHYALKYIDED